MAADKDTSARRRKLLAALAENWQAEMSGFYTYSTLADRESDPLRSRTLRHLVPRPCH